MSKTNRERAEIFCLEYFKMVRPFYLNALVSLLNKAENRGRRKERKRWKHYWMMCTPIDMKKIRKLIELLEIHAYLVGCYKDNLVNKKVFQAKADKDKDSILRELGEGVSREFGDS